MYLLLDLVQMQGLPWRRLTDRNDVKKLKEECRTSRRGDLFVDLECREEFSSILEYIDRLSYSDHIDYNYIYGTMKLVSFRCLTKCKILLNYFFTFLGLSCTL